MNWRRVVWASAAFSAVARFPGLFWPIRPDEAGFTLVARAWHPMPDSLYGTYFVDRPPSLIALFKLSDWLGGPLFIRVFGVLACVALVFASAACARAVCRYADHPDGLVDRVAAVAALVTAGLVANADIDPTAAKGEILGIPLVLGSCWLALRALETRSLRWAGGAGLVAMLALGLKQNLVGGLVFGGLVLVGSALTRRVDGRAFLRLAGAAVAGAALPVLATVGWALVAGVHLSEVWFTVFGFRGRADAILSAYPGSSLGRRTDVLVLAVACGMVFVTAWFAVNLLPLLRRQPVLTFATLTMLTIDAVGVVLSGSYWGTYLFVLIPPLVIALVLCLTGAEQVEGAQPQPARRRWRTWVTRVIAAYVVVASVVSLVRWGFSDIGASVPGHAVYIGEAIKKSSQPGDTVVVYGGRPDIVMASGLGSPYDQLWSLPMRTLDPRMTELRSVLTGPQAPTWFVLATDLTSWDGRGQQVIAPVLAREYLLAGTICGRPVYRLRSADRPALSFDCTKPWTWADRGTS